MYQSDKDVWHDANHNVVEEGSPYAAFKVYSAGESITDKEAGELGLVVEGGKGKKAKAGDAAPVVAESEQGVIAPEANADKVDEGEK